MEMQEKKKQRKRVSIMKQLLVLICGAILFAAYAQAQIFLRPAFDEFLQIVVNGEGSIVLKSCSNSCSLISIVFSSARVVGEEDADSGMVITQLPQVISFPMESFPVAEGRLHRVPSNLASLVSNPTLRDSRERDQDCLLSEWRQHHAAANTPGRPAQA